MFNHDPKFYLLEKVIKKGYLIADIKINFDEKGNFKNNYKIRGFIKDTKISFLKKYKIEKLNFIFNYENDSLNIRDLSFTLNDLNFLSKNFNIKSVRDKFLISGEIENKEIELKDDNIEIFLRSIFQNLDIKKMILSSSTKFSFELNKKFQFSNLDFTSEVKIDEFIIFNNLKLNSALPQVDKNINLSNHKIKIDYKKKNLRINGSGSIFLQNKPDKLDYSVTKTDKKYNFKTSLKIKENPLLIDILNYEKQPDSQVTIKIEGNKTLKDKIKLDLISLEEKNNRLKIKGLLLDENLKIFDIKEANVDYFDRDRNKNKFRISSKKDFYYLNGSVFNAYKLVENLTDDENSPDFINKNFKIIVELDKLLLDKNYSLQNFSGNLSINNQEIINGNLIGYFSDNKKLKFTVRSEGNEKITTLFLDNAKAIVNKYKFIKGFEEGVLDFYSSKKNEGSISKLKIYDFKLKELPVLTKLLTLASLQGIADLLSGEGIRFNEFEMNFRNKGNLMTIDEIYAIGPAISILMEGYIEKSKLISLRGTLVPATTINKVIGSIPLIGDILVGKKTGEGVFGVSFKIKGPPKKLETSVNPIKTLTPRFITRTLEKIKKN